MMIYPVATEKAINLISKQNTLIFIVSPEATRQEVKKVVEEQYAVKVAGVRTQRTFQGKKRAFVRLAKESPAMELAAKLKIL
jgi:ribosomal protein L23